VEKI
jgi:NAD(P)-dependent dehydrogenase (short-subunit alcohol dehydrogenase family)